MRLEVKNISKKHNNKFILKDFSISVNSGEIVAIFGPNGAGKTTSFYIMSGVIKATSGTIKIDNQDITNYPLYVRAKLGIGYLPQETTIFNDLSVEKNIQIALEIKYKHNKVLIEEKTEQLLNEFNLQHIRKNLCGALSGGEQRRVEIARILAIGPSFLLLDEPFSGIDPITIENIQNIIKELKRKNIGIIITDHNIRETLHIVDKVYVLCGGEIIFSGTPDEFAKNDKVKNIYLGSNFDF